MLAAVPQTALALPAAQVWTLFIGGLSPLVTYLMNHYAAWVDEKVKAVVFTLVAAISGGLYQALTVGAVGFNGKTAEYVLTAIVGAVGAHHGIYKPGQISTALGAGSNAPRKG